MAAENITSEAETFLPEQQERFCCEYVSMERPNGTRAAILAGYSEKTACEQASRLLRSVKVRSRVKELRREILIESGYDKEKIRESIMRKLTAILEANVTDVIHISPGENDPEREQVLNDLAELNGGQRVIDFGETLIVPTTAMTEETSSAIKSIKVTPPSKKQPTASVDIDMHDSIAAARLLAEIAGLKQADVQVTINLTEDLDDARMRMASGGAE